MMKILTLCALLVASGCAGLPATSPDGGTAAAGAASARDETAAGAAESGELAEGEVTEGEVAETAAAIGPDAEAVRAALRRSLPFVEAEGIAWMEGRVSVQDGTGCVSCHHVGYAVWSHAEARRAGAGGDSEATAGLDRTAGDFLAKPRVPRALSLAPYLLAHERPDDGLIAALLDLQTDSGAWDAKGQFPTQRRPVPESNAVATMYASIVLARAGDGASAGESGAEVASARRRAREKAAGWLAGAEPGTSVEWLGVRLILATATEPPEHAEALRAELAARQRPDGGWGWLAEDESDAFSTGQAVYALAATGGAASEAVSRGAAFLLAAQEEDGSWRVPSATISREPSADKDVIYHFWGTAWAALGLARSLEPGTEAGAQIAAAPAG